MRPVPLRRLASLLLAASLACGGKSGPESAKPEKEEEEPIIPLATAALAGQSVAVIPLTILIADEALMATAPFNDRVRSLAWADSIVGVTLAARAPEPKWVLPPDLRRMAHRAVGVAPDPDHMGQGIMRAPKLEDVPDPLRSKLRALLAVAGDRFAFIPAAVGFTPDSIGYRADVSLVLADVRLGKVIWRTETHASGTTPARALTVALDAVFPAELSE
jgi:hypothetical protein